MVQVDIVWSYAFGASFAATAARQLAKEPSAFHHRHYTFFMNFLACLFAPSGLYLLWQFPAWETMQVATCREDIPAWLVVLFAITNITQGMLGYWTTFKLIKKGSFYGAHLNWMVSWTVFWFILVCGWDCTGWQRLLYDSSLNHGELWAPGKHMGLTFFTGNVFLTLVGMGVLFAPMLIYAFVNGIREGARSDPAIPPNQVPGPFRILLFTFPTMFGLCLAIAILAAWTVMGFRSLTGQTWLGYLIGLPVFAVFAHQALFRKNRPMYFIARQLFIREP
jgi:hypothetical protein